jgi:hypothetical protein
MVLRVWGRATPTAAAAATGLTAREVRRVFTAAAAAGLVDAEADTDRFVLTAAGRRELTALLAREPIDRLALTTLYDAFLATDARVKASVTAWQLTTLPPHAGNAAAAFAAVRAVAAEARAIAERLAAVVSRYAGYARRLGVAAEALARGDAQFVASPRLDSLHQVWFELHEDLLVTLGRERAS